jgi:hypothetical protein
MRQSAHFFMVFFNLLIFSFLEEIKKNFSNKIDFKFVYEKRRTVIKKRILA